MSLKQMLKALMDLGLSDRDAEVYMFLATKAPQKAADIADALRIKNNQLHACLKNLQDKGVVSSVQENPKLFSAVPIEDALSMFINANLREAESMEQNRQKILTYWQTMIKKDKAA